MLVNQGSSVAVARDQGRWHVETSAPLSILELRTPGRNFGYARASLLRAAAMPVGTLENVSLAYGHVPLLDRVQLVIEPGDKIALIGRNATGKRSLLRVLSGEAAAANGVVWRQPEIRLPY